MSSLAQQSAQSKLTGTKELIEQLRLLKGPKGMASALRAAVKDGMKPVRDDAAQQLEAMTKRAKPRPHRSYKKNWLPPGYAAEHIGIETFISKDKQAAKAIVGPDKEAFYASQFVELGVPAYGIPARPWLIPSMQANQSYSLGLVRKALQRKLALLTRKKAGKR